MTAESAAIELLPRDAMKRVGIIIPTYNAASHWPALRDRLDRQGFPPQQILIIDSSSKDGTPELVKAAGYNLLSISQHEFSHGGTRQRGSDLLDWAEILVYLTQDALPTSDSSIQALCSAFRDPEVGAACGRQLPRNGAGAIERHARFFNYPDTSSVRSFEAREVLGIKAAFLSNSFAAYRREALIAVGGFPTDVIMAEDSVVAARLLMGGWKVAYVAGAAVVHSHGFRIGEEFSRYFDTGVHHANEPWIREAFGHAGGEGKRFVKSELAYLLAHDVKRIPYACVRTASKLIAFQLGLREKRLSKRLKQRISLQPGFWNDSSSKNGRQ